MRIPRFPIRTALAFPLAALCLFGCWDDEDDDNGVTPGSPEPVSAVAQVRGYLDTSIRGTVSFHETTDSLDISAAIAGLVPGSLYAIHVHEVGDCSTPDASGGHFMSTEMHGNPFDSAGTHHRGDLPNLVADSSGMGHMDFSTSAMDLHTVGKNAFLRSVVVHALPDDFTSQPAGNSGARIACGVIGTRNGSSGSDTTGSGGTDTSGTGGTDTTGPVDLPPGY
jgi:Cu-Zn family superoxide dismutase